MTEAVGAKEPILSLMSESSVVEIARATVNVTYKTESLANRRGESRPKATRRRECERVQGLVNRGSVS